MEYRPSEIEPKWRAAWASSDLYRVENGGNKPKFYVLDMFPYPSGAGLHVGHPLGYIASDIFARYKRMRGFNVLHPMGFDAFGLPAEQYAIETGVHPADATAKNKATYRQQLDLLGMCYDWNRELSTTDPNYYKWTQWIFTQMFSHFYNATLQQARPISELVAHFEKYGIANVPAAHNLDPNFSAEEWLQMTDIERDSILMEFRIAYRREGFVNWCETLGTVLSNDEVVNGVSERGGHAVEIKPLMMWSLRTSAYAERLISGLETVDFPEPVRAMQRNWIGKSEGARVFFELQGHELLLEVYTTRPDTLYGVTFLVLAPEHELVAQITTPDQTEAVETYVKYVTSRSERERLAKVRLVTGASTGAFATHPITGLQLPIYISEYVLKGYGTGAIMAVPAGDERDKRFAEHFELPIIEIIDRSEHPNAGREDKVGRMINSEMVEGLEVTAAIGVMTSYIETANIGTRKVNFRLRDATFSRQRYWGEPIPALVRPDGTTEVLPLSALPLALPDTTQFTSLEGKGPLQHLKNWWQLPDGSVRETDTMPGFAGSSWYYLRYMDPNNENRFAASDAIDYWQQVDFYIGGAEHAVGHLIYSRMFHKFLFDLKQVPTEEPYKKLFNQGMIQGIIEKIWFHKPSRTFYSADRITEHPTEEWADFFMPVQWVQEYGDLEKSHILEEGVAQYKKFRPKFAETPFEFSLTAPDKFYTHSEIGKMSKSKYNVVNPDEVVAKYGADSFRMFEMFLGPIEQSKPWNVLGITGVSGFMRRLWSLFYNIEGQFLPNDTPATAPALFALHTCIKKVTEDIERFSHNTCVSSFMTCVNELKKANCSDRSVLGSLLQLLAPFAPFVSEELWAALGHPQSIHTSDWPVFDPAQLVANEINFPICINGKKRAEILVAATLSATEIEALALQEPAIVAWLAGQIPKKVVFVPGRMVNIVM